jgi:hypothetical protein
MSELHKPAKRDRLLSSLAASGGIVFYVILILAILVLAGILAVVQWV